jgi:hypothetical protein
MSQMNKQKIFRAGSVAASLIAASLLGACSDTASTNNDQPFTADDQAIVVATSAMGTGSHAVFDASAPFAGADEYSPTAISDVTVAAHGEYFYRIERYNADNVTKFHASAPDTPIWQYSTQGANEVISGNPYGLVFASENKAYLPRYGSNTSWIVDPSTTTEAGFKIGELDLSAYDDGSGTPEAIGGVVVDGKLFIAMQRLDITWAPGEAFLAVFDIDTNEEIDTGMGGALKGIPLTVKNPLSISYSADTGMIYVAAIGRYAAWNGAYPAEYTGGIEAIDPSDYSTDLILDDGDATTHPIGQISDAIVVSASKGYVVGYADWNDNGLYEFNPITGTLVTDTSGNPQPVAGLSGVNIGGLGVDADDKLWVSIQSVAEPGLRVIDTSDNSVVQERVATTLNPGAIVFVDAP